MEVKKILLFLIYGFPLLAVLGMVLIRLIEGSPPPVEDPEPIEERAVAKEDPDSDEEDGIKKPQPPKAKKPKKRGGLFGISWGKGMSEEELLSKAIPTLEARFPGLKDLGDGKNLAILAFKRERVIELWKARPGGWSYIGSLKMRGVEALPGPRLHADDAQVPEGVYQISALDPNEPFAVSLQLDYPNAYDLRKSEEDQRPLPKSVQDEEGNSFFAISGDEEASESGHLSLNEEDALILFAMVHKNGLEKTWVLVAPLDLRDKEAEIPQIEGISWEEELYGRLRDGLRPFRK